MSTPIRRSTAVEQDYAQAITSVILGLIALLLGFLSMRYGEILQSVAWALYIAAAILFIHAIYRFVRTTRVPSHTVVCPYCKSAEAFTAPPQSDFTCEDCHRLVAVEAGRVLPVMSIECGNCHTENFYTPRSRSLVCEECSQAIALPGHEPEAAPQTPSAPQPPRDTKAYKIILEETGNRKEELIGVLIQFLNATRQQIESLLAAVPIELFTGVDGNRARLIQQRLEEVGAKVELHPLED